MRAEIATTGRVALGWPADDLFDSEEQDEPLAGQDHHDTIDSLHYPLRGRLAGPDCYVAAELRVHRDPANLHDYREPDVLVALGVPDRVRPRYDLWTEPKAPDLVIEVLSPSSLENGDLTEKRNWYRREGVQEYVVLDPSGNFAPEPRLQAWKLGDRPDGSADVHRRSAGEQTLWSELIPYGWRVVDNWVRVVDQVTGEVFPPIWAVESQLRREVEWRQAAQREAQAAREAARLAEERAIRAEERERQTAERERLARAELAAEGTRHAVERAGLEREHAEALAQLRRRLGELGQRS